MAKPTIKIEGLAELRRDLRRLGDADLKAALREANRSVAKRVVDKALPNVPVRTGRLRASVRALASQGDAKVKAGAAAVPYAAAIEYGRGRRKGLMFLHRAADEIAGSDAGTEYLEQIERIARRAGWKK